METKRHWDRFYERTPAETATWHETKPRTSLRLIAATGYGPSAGVLDVGGGGSLLVDRLVEAGYARVGVVDVSSRALAAARNRLGEEGARVAWYEADVTSFTPPERWDIWHDRALFHFLTEPEQRAKYREALLAALVPGGSAILAVFGPGGPDRCSGLPVLRCTAAMLCGELGPEFSLVESVEETHRTPHGRLQEFVYGRFLRAGERAPAPAAEV